VVHCLEKGWYYEATFELLEGLEVAIAARLGLRSGRIDGAELANESPVLSEDKKESRTYRNRLTRNA
jgi:hypothetical protein